MFFSLPVKAWFSHWEHEFTFYLSNYHNRLKYDLNVHQSKDPHPSHSARHHLQGWRMLSQLQELLPSIASSLQFSQQQSRTPNSLAFISSCISCTLRLKGILEIRETSLFQYLGFKNIPKTGESWSCRYFVLYVSYFEAVNKQQVFYLMCFSK